LGKERFVVLICNPKFEGDIVEKGGLVECGVKLRELQMSSGRASVS
jgi:hypothetical protein